MDFQTPTRYYPRADLCPSWHYPTQSNPCCWNWFPPQVRGHCRHASGVPSPSSCTPLHVMRLASPCVQPTDFKDFAYAWQAAGTPGASLVEITDTRSSARGAYAVAPLAGAPPPVDLSGSLAQWMPRVPANGSLILSFAAVYCVTNTTAGDAAAAAQIVLEQVRRGRAIGGSCRRQTHWKWAVLRLPPHTSSPPHTHTRTPHA